MSIYPSSPVILDAALFGTTLEDVFKIDLTGSTLWSAEQTLESPETIVNAHLAFLRSGARIILTATYQCSPESFQGAGRTTSEYESALIRAIELADEARARYRNENPKCAEIRIALSLGPYGANLSPAQEFTGIYPPPYGPKAFSPDGQCSNTFGDDSRATQDSIKALTKFHLDRLLIVARHPEAWKSVDIIAFETIPLRRELLAIRTAIRDLQAAIGPGSFKPWWTTFTLPDGKCPERAQHDGPRLTVEDLVRAAFVHDVPVGGSESSQAPVPTAIGINCTSPALVLELARKISETTRPISQRSRTKPWFILYPNRGYVYDSSSKTWKGEDTALSLGNVLKQVRDEMEKGYTDVWGGFVYGGCCGTGPDEIKQLGDAVGP